LKFLIKTFEGLETVLAQEVANLGLTNIQQGKRLVSCEGIHEDIYRLNLGLHTAVRVLVPVLTFPIENEDDYYNSLMKIDWEQFIDLESTFAIDAVISTDIFTHSKYVAYRMKDAIADWFSAKYTKRPNVDTDFPDVRFNVHIHKNIVSISLDSSGESLHKRGYRQEINEAPMNEVLAAGILRLAGYDGTQDLYDPMCGSGTFLIEGACIAANRPPCLFRPYFGFQQWKDFDEELFMDVKYDFVEAIKPIEHKIIGADITMQNVRKSEGNVKKAKFDDIIKVERKDFFRETPPEGNAICVLNPPYGERMELTDAKTFYEEMGDVFKRKYAGKKAFVITSNLDAFKFLGLRPNSKVTLFNGPLECRLHGYELYDGSTKEKLGFK
jgi:putative N6-adenine-specific DNA methylase